jgi:hypothetical protein
MRQVVQILKAGLTYFAIVFGMGFVFGAIRTVWVVPHVGTRLAELMETPLMFVVTIVTARWIVLHLALPSSADCPSRDGRHRALSLAPRRIRPCTLASRPFDKSVPRNPRPRIGNGLLRDAWGICPHAAARREQMTSQSQGVREQAMLQNRWIRWQLVGLNRRSLDRA